MTKVVTAGRRCGCVCCGGISQRTVIRLVSVCLVQGLLWSAVSVFLLAIQTCGLQFESMKDLNFSETHNKVTYVLNLIYVAYLTGNCYPTLDGHIMNNFTSERTYNLLFLHGFLNAVWIPICVLLMVGVAARLRGCLVVILLYLPWLLVTFLVVAYDLIAASLYIVDLKHAKDLQDFLAYIAYRPSVAEDTIPKRHNFDSITHYAPLFFILFFTRGFLLTLYNLTTLFQVFGVTVKLCRERRFKPGNILLDGYDDIYAPILEGEMEAIPLHSFLSPRSKQNGRLPGRRYESMTRPGVPARGPNMPNGFHSNQAPEYLDLLQYQTPLYQHIYEDIWRDVKKEKLAYNGRPDSLHNTDTPVTPSSPVYDYLGRPVLDFKLTESPEYNAQVLGSDGVTSKKVAVRLSTGDSVHSTVVPDEIYAVADESYAVRAEQRRRRLDLAVRFHAQENEDKERSGTLSPAERATNGYEHIGPYRGQDNHSYEPDGGSKPAQRTDQPPRPPDLSRLPTSALQKAKRNKLSPLKIESFPPVPLRIEVVPSDS